MDKPCFGCQFGNQGAGGSDRIHREADRLVGVRVAQAVMVKDFEQFGFIERGDCLARFVVIYQDDFQARRIEHTALVADSKVMAAIVDHEKIVVFFAQDAVERIADMTIGWEAWNGCISNIAAGGGHNINDALIAHIQARADNLLKEVKQAEAIDHAKRNAVFADYGSNAPSAGSQRPGFAKRVIRVDGVQLAGNQFEAWRGIGQQNGRLELESFQHPGRLLINCPGARSDGVESVTLAQEPGVGHGSSD